MPKKRQTRPVDARDKSPRKTAIVSRRPRQVRAASDHGIVLDERGQEQPKDKKAAQG